MNIYRHRRPDASQALYVDGNLQFDSRDEAVYHESLALPALCLAAEPKRVLICGGGDGLALREVLRFPGIEVVTLIDCSQEILDLASTEFSELNHRSLEDPRVSVVVADALEFALDENSFDVIICDFTFPTTKESALGFTLEWYQKLKAALREGGVMAINGVSPQNTASAFACLVATVRSSGLSVLPYRVCIPSFRDHGYGTWGFVLAAKKRLTIKGLQQLKCPVQTSQTDLAALARGARFSVGSRVEFAKAPINLAAKPVLQALLLNPSAPTRLDSYGAPPDFSNLVRLVEISHPYHSRGMIEALAQHVAGSLQSIDLRKLVEELTLRASRLPKRIVEELGKLKEYLARSILDLDLWGKWAARLFATLILVMTIANSISPDPAFAKGHAGLGHASFSRSSSAHEDFGGGTSSVNAPISGRGFTSTYGRDPVDIYGYHYSPRVYFYGSNGGYGGVSGNEGSGRSPYQPKTHKPLFVLDDDLLAMENGDFVIPLSDTVFLVVANGKVTLMDSQGGAPLMEMFAEPKLFQDIRNEVAAQSKDLDREVTVRRDWLSWAGWTSSMFSTVKSDNDEYNNIQDLQRRLAGSMKNLGYSSESKSIPMTPELVELFVGCHIVGDDRIEFYTPGGYPAYADGKEFTSAKGERQPMPPQLKAAIVSVLKKMIQESEQDIASNKLEQKSLLADQSATELDLGEYQGILMQYGPAYEVDYGTDSIPATDAIARTQGDLNSISADQTILDMEDRKTRSNLVRFRTVLQAWGG